MKINVTAILVIIILLLIGAGFIGHNYYQNKIEDVQVDLRKERIKNDTLQILADGQARKLVADTLTIRQLNKKIDSLGIELKGRPTSYTGIGFKPKDTIKITDTIYVEEGRVTVIDYYPQRENYFAKYSNVIDILEGKGKAEWTFNDIKLDLVISENKDGTYEANMKAPSFIQINSLDVQALPIDPIEPDNFGILLGAGYGRDFGLKEDYLRVDGGIRFKKTYLMVGGNTNKQADVGIKFEF